MRVQAVSVTCHLHFWLGWLWLNLFNAELSPTRRYWPGSRSQGGGEERATISTATLSPPQARSKDQEILEEGGGAGP